MRLSLRPGDDRGSMPMAMLVVTVVLSLSTTMVPIVVRQIMNSQNYAQRASALDAAQAGMDVMMARVRAASDESLNGFLEDVPPCQMTGVVGVADGNVKSSYSVSVTYRDRDGDVMAGCAVNEVPTTAIVESAGISGSVTRTLVATYVFSTSNTNIPGGQIKVADYNLCFDAGAAKSPAAGTAVGVRTCDGSSRQQFGYTPDLYLKLIYSESSTAQAGMCLSSGPSPHRNGTTIVFQPCPTVRDYRFQWGLDGSSMFHASYMKTTSAGATVAAQDSYCITRVATPASIALGSCSANGGTTVWRSDPGVGAGMAGDSTNQLVNYKQFSRCLDVTNKDVNQRYMIAWYCKQDPSGNVELNQQWTHPVPVLPAISATGPIVVNNPNSTVKDVPNKDYCLRSPGSAASTVYVTVESCPTASAKLRTEYQWTVYHDTGDYGTSYRIMDYKGFCLTPTDLTVASPDWHGDHTAKVKVAVCNTSDLQKWNAPSNIQRPTPLTNLTEK
ncbi:ricin-type beta-trefoil lectin domain protein [Actinoplanes teichomyceticus]|uniref:ricin-type beta-trefoil lectin domain protein n=1 Tax=Actinoplanes teichomyceticus TaxID=1867 RepID=UPI000F0A8A3D|nr:ricin-type beta-trefoil lectin domain protein [Actinoplanes teichomyceticus]GIF10112.1 hypothetical protein Ate01nite_01440 [Actinoplanes teichomyceticus]